MEHSSRLHPQTACSVAPRTNRRRLCCRTAGLCAVPARRAIGDTGPGSVPTAKPAHCRQPVPRSDAEAGRRISAGRFQGSAARYAASTAEPARGLRRASAPSRPRFAFRAFVMTERRATIQAWSRQTLNRTSGGFTGAAPEGMHGGCSRPTALPFSGEESKRRRACDPPAGCWKKRQGKYRWAAGRG